METNNKIIAVAVVVILVVVAAASVVIFSGSSDEEKTSYGTGRLLVYGNADNDDYFDEDDLELIRQIAESGEWDEDEYPLADANYDGVVDENDITYMESLLNGESNRMYYVGGTGDVFYFNYPATGRTIAASNEYGLMLPQVLGIYDRVVAGASTIKTLGELRYPGIDEMIDLGTYSSSDYASFVESFLSSGCTILLGQVITSVTEVYEMVHDSGQIADVIILDPSAEVREGGIDVVASILTAGVLLDCADAAREYANYCDELTSYVSEHVGEEDLLKFVCAYNTDNAVTTTVHTTDGRDGSMTGVIWTLSFTPLYSDIPWNELDASGRSLNVEIESIIEDDPDIIILAIWGKATAESDPEEVQAIFDETAEYFSETRAYKTGQIYGINYEMFGTYLGVGGLALLCSYIWPDSFTEEEGWDLLQEAIDKFTLIDADVQDLGGIIPYKVNTSS